MIRLAPITVFLTVACLALAALVFGDISQINPFLYLLIPVLTGIFLASAFLCPVRRKPVTRQILFHLFDEPIWGWNILVPKQCECGHIYGARRDVLDSRRDKVPAKEHLP